jgi:hypothetical protein
MRETNGSHDHIIIWNGGSASWCKIMHFQHHGWDRRDAWGLRKPPEYHMVHTVRILNFFEGGGGGGGLSPEWDIYAWQKSLGSQCAKFVHILLPKYEKIKIYQFKSVHNDLGCDTMWTCRWVPMFQTNILPPSSRLKPCSSEMLVPTYKSTQQNSPKDHPRHLHNHENLKSNTNLKLCPVL